MSDAVANALAAAKAAAGKIASPAPGLPAPTGTASAPSTYVAPGTPVSMDDMMVGSMQVDAWLKVKEHGLIVGKGASLFPELVLMLDMAEVSPCFVVKAGDPAQYRKSYDHVTSASGGSWGDALRWAQQIDNKATEYKSADLPFVVLEDIVDPKTKEVLCEAGKRLGHSTSTTNWSNFEKFYKVVKEKGLQRSKVVLKIGSEARSNNRGHKWGVITFLFLDAVPGEVEAAAVA